MDTRAAQGSDPRDRPDRRAIPRAPLLLLGPAVAVLIGWCTAGERTPMGLVDVALLLAVVDVAVALASWWGGLATSVAAGLALDYFHTQPVGSLRITSAADVAAVLLLGALGISVSSAAALRVRGLARSREADAAAGALAALGASSNAEHVATDLWLESVRAASHNLALVSCRVLTAPTPEDLLLPEIARHRPRPDTADDEFVLPERGALIAFADPRRGHVLLIPRPGIGAVRLDRRAVTAFVDNLDLALSGAG